jgi:YebC/PmpR family DNA-binding regulatory protein
MSGHSKWSTIKHKKALKDSRKGKLFSKLIKEITVAARTGGGDINANPRLRTAVNTAKASHVPNDNIDRAIKKGTGELQGENLEEINYEGYGPAGLAIMAMALTDNRNRTVSDVRRIFEKHGGNMGTSGCVAWMFSKKGLITVARNAADEDKLMEVVLEAGAEDVAEGDEGFEITTPPEAFDAVCDALAKAEIATESAEVSMVPQNTVSVSGKDAEQAMKLLEDLDDHDDVQSVASNMDIAPEELERLSAA